MLQIRDLSKNYGELQVIQDLNMDLESKKIHCIFGPSGCGKTTLVNIISGISLANGGGISGLSNKTVSYIFQEDRLLPWATVKENILLVLGNSYDKDQALEITNDFLSLVNLSEFKNVFPDQLSGGMKQRASIARAFAYDGDVFIMDEPFKGIDFDTKKRLMDYIIGFWQKKKKLFIMITHDADEALYMSDIVHVFQGPPLTLKNQIKIEVPHHDRKMGTPIIEQYRGLIAGNAGK